MLDVPVWPWRPGRPFWDELGRRPAHGPRRPHDVEAQKAVVAHADPEGPALQPRTHCILLRLQVIPLLCFRCILGCIDTSGITPVVGVERQDLSCYWNRCGRLFSLRQKQAVDTCWKRDPGTYWKRDLETPDEMEAPRKRKPLETDKKRSQRFQEQLRATRGSLRANTSSDKGCAD